MDPLQPETSPAEKFQFLSGGGEMGMLMRSKDWSLSPVGTADTWPQSLRTTLSILLNSKFPMFLFWGPDLICFYNDAYRPSLGEKGKHPDILGSRGEDYWSEIWNEIKPIIDMVLVGGEAVFYEDMLLPIFRNGKMEDVYWTFSYSPINDESGKTSGIFVTCCETTEQVINRMKLEESKDQLQFAINAAQLGTWDYNPLTNKFTSNDQLKEWFGLPAEQEIELHHAINAIAETDRQRITDAITATLDFSSGGRYEAEYTIVHPVTKTKTIVHAKGKAWFTNEKFAYRFNGTIEDVTKETLARKKMEESDQRFRAAVQAVNGVLWTNNAEGKMEGEQPGWEVLTGQHYDEYQGYGWAAAVHPDDAAPTIAAWNESVAERKTFVFEHRVKLKEGNYRKFTIRAIPLLNTDGSIREWVGVHTDITDQKKAEAEIKESEERFRTMAEATDILISTGDETSNATYFNKAWSTITGRPMEDLLQFGWADLVHPDDRDSYVNLYLSAFAKKESFTKEFRILDKNKKYSWLLSNGSPRFRTDGSFAGYIASCIDITDRKQTEEAIQRFKFMADNATDPFILMREDGSFEYLNKMALKRWGYTADEAAKLRVPDVDHIYNDELFNAAFKKAQGENIPAFETIHKNKNGDCFPVEVNMGGLNLGGKPFMFAIARDITERKKIERILKESEKEYRLLADSLPEMVWTTDHKGNQTFASRRWKEYTGLDPYDLTTFEKMIHPEDLHDIIKVWTECLASGKEYKTQVRVKSKNGDYQWFYVNGEPVKNETGEIEKWIGAFTNINEQKKAETELRNSFLKIKEDEERQNIIIEASELGTWELNLKTREVKYSLRYLQIMGYKEMKHLTHEELLQHLHPDDLQVREKAFRRALETGYLQYEARLIWNDQTIHWMEGKGKVFYNEHNEPNLLIGTIRDITEEKYYQQELKDREQKFRLLADSMPQFVWTGNAEGILSYFNQSVYNYSGLTPEQINKDGWLQIVHPDDQEENIKRWIHSVTTGTDFLFEHRFKRYDGEYRWQLSRAIPQRDAAGNIQMWVGSSTDIQEIKELDQQKDFFISMASHELKTPITSIKGYVQMLQTMYGKGADSFLKNSLRVIDKQIVTLTNLISDLLDLSKIKSGSLFLNKEDFKINDLTSEIIDEIEHVNPDYIFIFSGATGYTVHADRERIGQVLRNFLTNAVKYSPDSKTISIECTKDDADVIISVQDSGIGINKNDQEKIFERFYRVEGKNEKTFPGFGIGLFISSEIVSRHQGTIGVKSEPGKGSTFYFSIPLK